MPGRLEGKVTIISGGGGGFGKGIAKKCVSEGAKVIITDFNENVGKKTAEELKCDFVKADVTRREDWERVVKEVDEKYGAIHAVVSKRMRPGSIPEHLRHKVQSLTTLLLIRRLTTPERRIGTRCEPQTLGVVFEAESDQSTNDVTDADFDMVMRVNVKSIYYSTNTIIPYMQKKGNGKRPCPY